MQIGGSFSLIGGIRTLVEGNEESKQYCKNEDAFGPFDECVETFNNIGKATFTFTSEFFKQC